jgi:hypothetical protein
MRFQTGEKGRSGLMSISIVAQTFLSAQKKSANIDLQTADVNVTVSVGEFVA